MFDGLSVVAVNPKRVWRTQAAAKITWFALGVVCALALVSGFSSWRNRHTSPNLWNASALTAVYTGMDGILKDDGLNFTFRYSIENHTDADYRVADLASITIFKRLSENKDLVADSGLTIDVAIFIPARQKVNVGIEKQFRYSDFNTNRAYFGGDLHKIGKFKNRRLAEIDGFALLTRLYRITPNNYLACFGQVEAF